MLTQMTDDPEELAAGVDMESVEESRLLGVVVMNLTTEWFTCGRWEPVNPLPARGARGRTSEEAEVYTL